MAPPGGETCGLESSAHVRSLQVLRMVKYTEGQKQTVVIHHNSLSCHRSINIQIGSTLGPAFNENLILQKFTRCYRTFSTSMPIRSGYFSERKKIDLNSPSARCDRTRCERDPMYPIQGHIHIKRPYLPLSGEL